MHRTILVVDDEHSIRKMVVEILHSEGYRNVVEAEDGLAAYDLIRDHKTDPTLVITDINMARMNGAELTDRLRSEFPSIRVLCMSAFADSLSPNGHYFLAKPFTPKALLAMVRDVFDLPADNPTQAAEGI